MNTKKTLLFALFCTLLLPASAKIKLPAVICDNMVLQQQTSAKLWGEASKDKKITITTSWNNKTYSSKSSATGEWLVEVETPQAGGPYEISFSDGETLTLKNVLIGEVWICSGQSNMNIPLRGYIGQPVEGGVDAIVQANPENRIRVFSAKQISSKEPLNDCEGEWLESNPETAQQFSAVAYFFAQHLQKSMDVPVGLICTNWGGSKIQAWISKPTFNKEFSDYSLDILNKDIKDIENHRGQPTLLYNAMIHPLTNYAIKGALWYQGESNRKEAKLYTQLFPAMVKQWREEWKQGDFPFYYVQIAPYIYEGADSLLAAELRQAQLTSLSTIANSGMVVTADLGEETCIHPAKKEDVGKRLALLALAKTYNRKGTPWSGPLFSKSTLEGNKMILAFEHAQMGLHCAEKTIAGFELAGSDKVFYPAEARFADKTRKIEVVSDKVSNPTFVRYAYRNYCPVTLFNNYKLPMSPFTSEK